MMVHFVALASSSTSLGMSVFPDTIDALDNSIREYLQKTSNEFFLGALASSFVVAIGVALEGPELLHEMWPRLFTFFTKGSIPRIRKFKCVIKKIGFWGWLLVVVGIMGEGIFEALQNRAEGQLQTFNDILLTDAQRNAGSARASAVDAANAASRAEYESEKATASSANAMDLAQGARKEADSFERDIVSAKKQATEAESHLADALQRAADAEKEALQLKEQLADRTLSDAQLESIRGKLAEYAGQEYDVTAYWDSPESVGIANRVHLALQMAHWKFLPMTAWRGLMGGVVGIKISVHPDADEPTLKAAQDLTLALQAEGLEAKEEMENPKNPKSNIISLSVGSKR